MQTKPKILLISPIVTDCVSSWRAAGPLSKLETLGKIEVKYSSGENVSWIDVLWCDIVMMHRPFLPHHVPIMTLVKELGKPIWADYDDHLFQVHPSNSVYFNYVRQDVQNSIKQCLQLSDVVSVSVDHLQTVYAPFVKKAITIPNAWDDRFIKPVEKVGNSNVISWRGSDSHKNDLLSYIKNIVAAIGSTPNYTWKFIGYHAWEIPHALGMPSFGGRVQWVSGQQFWTFYRNFGIINPDLNIVPLEFTDFNMSKSNIAWLEAAMAGAPSVVPNWEMWDKPGALKYSTPEEFQNHIIEGSKDKANLRKLRNEAVDYITTELSLDKINQKRMAIIEELMK